MAKVYGVTFLGAPRTKKTKTPPVPPLPDERKRSGLAICCVMAVLWPWLLPMLSAAVPLPAGAC
ncbi:hypothetical protein ACNKHV_17065 [Shigella flexneri]